MTDFECYYLGQPYEREERDGKLYKAACEYQARTELFDRGLYFTWKQNQFLKDGSIIIHPLDRQYSDWFAKNLMCDLVLEYFISHKEILKEASRYNYTADKWIEEWERLNDR